MAARFDAAAIERARRGSFGRPLRFFSTVGSTSTEAARWAAAGAPHGAVVVADHQTAGRGRLGRTWISRPGSALQFSLVLRPAEPMESPGLLPVALGLSLAEAIEDVTPLTTGLKWPNDVTISGHKVAGILVEARWAGEPPDAFVAGIGVNVAWSCDDLTGALGEEATSISCELARRGLAAECDRARLLAAALLRAEDSYVRSLEPSGRSELVSRATERSDVLGRSVLVRLRDGEPVEGVARALLTTGALEVEVNRERRAIEAGVIERVRLR
jgi:BirA family biotin operon repressor/biotin-[acetyl-CoA-carboxylase] ligase